MDRVFSAVDGFGDDGPRPLDWAGMNDADGGTEPTNKRFRAESDNIRGSHRAGPQAVGFGITDKLQEKPEVGPLWGPMPLPTATLSKCGRSS
jgi:hypothetical protein